jgi:spore coat protein SA
MRIAFVAQPFDTMVPPVRGGSLSMWIYYMARLCAARGHEPVIFGNHGENFARRTAREDGVEYIFTPTGLDKILNKAYEFLRRRVLRKADGDAPPLFGSEWHHRGYADQVAREISRRNPDVVHVMNYSQFIPTIRKRNPRAKLCLHMQCEWLTQLDPVVVRERLAQTDLVIGCSEYITRKIAAKFPEYANRCVTVPNAADVVPEESGSPLDSKTVLFVGRLSPEKGIHDLIRAFHRVLERFPDARLRIVGGAGSAPLEYMVGISDDPHVSALRVFYPESHNGSKDPYLEALEKEAGGELGKRIIFEGRADHHQIQQFYQSAGVLVNASLSESFGISLVEAMMHQVPVVSTKTGGMTYTVDPGRTGFLVDPANPEQLANAICEVFSDREKAVAMGKAGRTRALENFSWEKTRDLLLQRYESALN